MDLAELARRLHALEDVAEIKELKGRYWRSMDRRRFDEVRDCFAPDGVTIDMMGIPKCETREAFLEVVSRNNAPGIYNMHLGHNPRIALTGPDSADGQWDSFFTGINAGSRIVIQLSGEYQDSYVRQNGRWYIKTMRFEQTSFLMEEIDADGRASVLVLGEAKADAFK